MARERDSVAVHRPGVRSGQHVPLYLRYTSEANVTGLTAVQIG